MAKKTPVTPGTASRGKKYREKAALVEPRTYSIAEAKAHMAEAGLPMRLDRAA